MAQQIQSDNNGNKRCNSGGYDSTFMELFAGEAGLTRAVERRVGTVFNPADIQQNHFVKKTFNLLCKTAFKELKKKIKARQIRWVHLAPPCKTFSRARRRDRHAKARILRTRTFPGGLWPRSNLVQEANVLASRSAQIAALQHKANGWVSLENPAGSFIWEYGPVKRLLDNPDMKLVFGDQCRFNGPYKKSTGWLTNAEFVKCLERSCPGPPEHEHEPLEGFTTDFSGNKVFKTSLAAEYPQGLCEVLAEQYARALEDQPFRPETTAVVHRDGDKKVDWSSNKWKREVENENCIGGLRNPSSSIRKLPNWREVGARLFWLFEEVMNNNPKLKLIVKDVGNTDPVDHSADIQRIRNHFAHGLGLADRGPSQQSLWGTLLKHLVAQSGDPDVEAASWPDIGTPLGILNAIPPGGVFPSLEESEYWVEGERLSSLAEVPGADSNYVSYMENQHVADKLFLEEVQQGFAAWSPDRKTLEDEVGQLVPSAIGVIVKMKAGVQKVRLVHDLRRSLVNQHILISERLVLPRMRDLVNDIAQLLELAEPGESVKVLSLDFSNAFKQLAVRTNEKRFLSGRACNGWFYYHKVLFGIRTGPLVWGRIAALVSRCTQSLLPDIRARLQTFVDDPVLVLRGTDQQIEDMAAKVLLLWSTLGLQIAWKKGTFGHTTDWIGATITVDDFRQRVTVEVSKDKIEEWTRLADSLLGKPVVARRELQRFTGKMNWAAGFAIQLKPFVRMLHAALHSDASHSPGEGLIYGKQIKPAVTWLKQFLQGFHHGLSWTTVAHWRNECCLDFYVDASPWGGGAVKLSNGKPIETFALTWDETDEKSLRAKIGSPGSQALWEAYMMLRCLWNWMTPELHGYVRIRGDAEGVLMAFVKRSAISPLLNRVVKEVTLHLAVNFRSLETLHVWSEDNTWADAISRLSDPNQPADYPPILSSLPRVVESPQYWHDES